MPTEDIIGKDDSHFFDLDISEQLKINDQKILNENTLISSEEENFIKSTGELTTFHTVKKSLVSDDGKIVGMCGISTDITKQKKLENLVKEQNKLLDAVLNNVDAYIYMKDEQRHFRYVNDKTAKMFGKPVEKIIGKLDADVIGHELADHFWKSDKQVFETNEKQVFEEIAHDDDGKIQHYLSTKMPYQLDENSQVLIGFSTDVTELYQLKEEFKKQANTDALTGLYNRRYFFNHAEKEFSRAKRHGLNMGVISIDIDFFKNINDKYGHPVGDKVLIEISKNILLSIRQEDILARVGGEEFAVILPESTLEEAKKVAQRISITENTFLMNAQNKEYVDIKLSIGLVSKRIEDESFDELFIRADNALYQAKKQGRNRVYIA
ncbi:diguanylate cyclase [Thalassotalea profundi]|uniref:diguanylate cyclase n=1 Tax=Thalassotalea profundi TaxID=2036687 RepID=A0ABQ3IE30_9GAMM|nr:diguanylate cyclase [Thalassotalea profundi]